MFKNKLCRHVLFNINETIYISNFADTHNWILDSEILIEATAQSK